MVKAVLSAIVTLVAGYYGYVLGDEIGFAGLGGFVAVAVMGAFIIYFNDKKNNNS